MKKVRNSLVASVLACGITAVGLGEYNFQKTNNCIPYETGAANYSRMVCDENLDGLPDFTQHTYVSGLVAPARAKVVPTSEEINFYEHHKSNLRN